MRFWKHFMLFYLGGTTYMFAEFLWRGRSHGSMFVLGGLCFWLIGHLHSRLPLPLWAQLPFFSVMITALELITGLAVNQDHSVWDYRNMPYQYLGQICLNYSLLWIPLSFLALLIYRFLAPKLEVR